ncbi:MAG: hypothetical protein NC409_04645 [Clostridium sp.]|nr:hypothetical protein [Clostridium sp.]
MKCRREAVRRARNEGRRREAGMKRGDGTPRRSEHEARWRGAAEAAIAVARGGL